MTDLVPTLIYCSVPGFASDDPRANLAAWEGVVGAATHVWETRLRAAGVGAHAIARVEDLMEDPWVRSHGLSLTQTIAGVGDMTMPGVAARLSRTPLRVGKPVRPVGSDAAEILGDLGMAADLDDLVREGALGFSLTPPAPLARI